MKFYIAEGNLGSGAPKELALKLIDKLRSKGWDVEYGVQKNKPTDMSEFGREEQITGAFADDFMACLAEIESEDPGTGA